MEKLNELTKQNVENAINDILKGGIDRSWVLDIDLGNSDNRAIVVSIHGGLSATELGKIGELLGDNDILVEPNGIGRIELYVVPDDSDDNKN